MKPRATRPIFAGAIIDGPAFGQNRTSEYSRLDVAVYPSMSLRPEGRIMNASATFDVVIYHWRAEAGAWVSGIEASPKGDLPTTRETRAKFRRKRVTR